MDFERPSFWLAVERDERAPANRFLTRRDLQLRLTLYDELDEHYAASWYRLARETDQAMALLQAPLAVSGRHLTMNLKALPRDPDRAYVQINMTWMDSQPAAGSGASVPPADHYSMRVRTEAKE